MKYVVIGAGRQGVAAAYDLAVFGGADQIQLLDIDKDAAEGGAARLNRLLGREVAKGAAADAGNIGAVRPYLEEAKGCISSVHFTFNLALTRLAIEKGVHLTDFGGNTGVVRQQLELDGEARAAGVCVVPDCGMGPGLNISLGTYVMSLLEEPKEVLIWDGGLPQDPQPPWNYACAFALGGLTNEYDGDALLPARRPRHAGSLLLRLRVAGVPGAHRPPRGVRDLRRPLNLAVDLRGQARSASRTRRSATRGTWRSSRPSRTSACWASNPIDVGGQQVVPRDVFHALLAPQIQREDFKDVCVMRVKGIGLTKGRSAEAVVELVDRYDEKTGFTAMQRLTGWHASIMLIAAVNRQVRPGVVSVEQALPGKTIVDESRRRGFNIEERVRVAGKQDGRRRLRDRCAARADPRRDLPAVGGGSRRDGVRPLQRRAARDALGRQPAAPGGAGRGSDWLATAKATASARASRGAKSPWWASARYSHRPGVAGAGTPGELIGHVLAAAAADGCRLAVLFSEIAPSYYEQFGFRTVPLRQVLLGTRKTPSPKGIALRSGDPRDVPALAEMNAMQADGFRFTLLRDPTYIAYAHREEAASGGLRPAGTPRRSSSSSWKKAAGRRPTRWCWKSASTG